MADPNERVGFAKSSIFNLWLIAWLIPVIVGCAQSGLIDRPQGVKVSGKVLLPSGTPLKGGTLILRPDSGLFGATAQIQSDGRFSLQDTAGNQDVIAGRYQVFVTFLNPSQASFKKSVHRRYQESEDGESDVFVDIQQSTDGLVIKLKN